jgi:hypothetical protein
MLARAAVRDLGAQVPDAAKNEPSKADRDASQEDEKSK